MDMLYDQQDLQDHHAGHNTRREETRQTKETLGRDDNIKEWTELPLAKTLKLAEDKDGWRKIVRTSVVPLQLPNA